MNGLLDRFKSATARASLRIKIAEQPKGRDQRIVNPWHAVSIAPGFDGGCPCARLLGKQRFLSGEAPRLPLAECSDAAHCRCQYRHHDDRRATPRRAQDKGLPSKTYEHLDRRMISYGRRADD